jgi:hypothetical protein
MRKGVQYFCCLLISVSGITAAAQTRELSFYEIRPTAAAPVIDGKLDEECWRTANRHSAYYEYFKPNPGPGALKTEFRMVYDARGLYLAVINYENRIGELRKNITDRDNPELWTDDCAELYFDPAADSIGFTKFTVNALGTSGDMRRIDNAVSLPEWNGNGWHVATSIEADRWIIEAFFPWEDLGRSAAAGDLWMFCHTRYSFIGNKFCGVTSSPGGNYNATGNFGYLYFAGEGKDAPLEQIAALLGSRIVPPWSLSMGEKMVFDLGQGTRILPVAGIYREECHRVEQLIGELEKYTENPLVQDARDAFMNVKEEYRKLLSDNGTGSAYRAVSGIRNRLDDMKWQWKLKTQFN